MTVKQLKALIAMAERQADFSEDMDVRIDDGQKRRLAAWTPEDVFIDHDANDNSALYISRL